MRVPNSPRDTILTTNSFFPPHYLLNHESIEISVDNL